MARRIWVKNPRVKGGGYYRTISARGARRPGGRRRMKSPAPGLGGRSKAARAIRQGIEAANIHMTRGEQSAILHMEQHGVSSVDLYTSRGTLKTYTLNDLQKKLKKGGPKRARRGGYLSHKAGDKQPRSTRPPKSRKPKKTGPIKQGDSVSWKSKSGRPMTGTVLRTGKSRKSHTIYTSDGRKLAIEKPRVKRATKGSVKKAQGKKRTLSGAQKAAKRQRAKARRAKRRK